MTVGALVVIVDPLPVWVGLVFVATVLESAFAVPVDDELLENISKIELITYHDKLILK